jgi:hypothetical protein
VGDALTDPLALALLWAGELEAVPDELEVAMAEALDVFELLRVGDALVPLATAELLGPACESVAEALPLGCVMIDRDATRAVSSAAAAAPVRAFQRRLITVRTDLCRCTDLTLKSLYRVTSV